MGKLEIALTVFAAACIIALLFFMAGDTAQIVEASKVQISAPTGFVNDTAGVLSSEAVSNMETSLKVLSDTHKAEVAVLTLKTTQPEDIAQFGIRLADAWHVGYSGADNGIILIVATEDRKIRIEVGSGAEAFLTDAQAGNIIRDDISPLLKAGDWDCGVQAGVNAIIKSVNNQ